MYNLAMTIYIEMFLIQNIIINFCLLKLVNFTTKNKTHFLHLLLASIVGAGFSIFSAIFITNIFLINILKFICAVIMLLIAFKQNFRQFVINYILLYIYTHALAGAIINLNSQTYQTSYGLIISSKFSLEAVCIIIIALTYIFELVTKHLKYNLKTNNFIYSVSLTKENKTINLNAYLDTGNLLNYKGNPVIIIDLYSYLKLTNSNLVDFYLCKSNILNVGTVTGNKSLKIFKVDKITIKQNKKIIKLENQYIGVNSTTSFKDTNYKALLSPMHF